MKCTQRLYLTKDRKKLVGEGDVKAAFLYAVPGDEIPDSAAEMFGLVGGGLKSAKEAAPPKDKERKGGSDKGGQGGTAKEGTDQAASGDGAASAGSGQA